jgi:hypothetical protein
VDRRGEIIECVHGALLAAEEGDWKRHSSYFSESVELLIRDGVLLRLRLSLQDWTTRTQSSLSVFTASQHILTNHIVEIEDDKASLRGNFQALYMYGRQGSLQSMQTIGGRLNLTLTSAEGAWRITKCELTVIWKVGESKLFEQASASWIKHQDSHRGKQVN